MNVTNDMSIFTLVSGASLPVQLVMLILLLTSLVSWWYIFIKVFSLKAANENVDQFEAQFWSGGDLNELYERITAGRKTPQGMASIFQAGLKEFIRYKQQKDAEVSDVMEATRRAMRAAYNRELDYLDSHLPFLASVGSVSPYIGLFGTVWGIMNAFMALGAVQQATLAMVAPPIAEALIATAIGLFAAIPAVIAYNKFSHSVEQLENSYANFVEEFSNILHRQAVSSGDSH